MVSSGYGREKSATVAGIIMDIAALVYVIDSLVRIPETGKHRFLDDWHMLDKASGYGIVTGCHPEGDMPVACPHGLIEGG